MIDWFARTARILSRRLLVFRKLAILSPLLVPGLGLAAWEPAEIVGLNYPRIARQARITGLVVVRVSVKASGSAREADVVSGHPLLGEAARLNALDWKFRTVGSRSDKSDEVFLVYRFVLRGNCAAKNCRELFVVEYPNFVLVRSEMPSIEVSAEREQ
jgi:TonB family protein